MVANTDTGTPIKRKGCQPTLRVSSRGTSTAARHASYASPCPCIQAMIGRTRFAPPRIMIAALSSTQASAKAAIVQNSEADGSV
jgi:hypothetical protein